MLDPLSALGLVSNVVQLVSFTADIIDESLKFSKTSSEIIPSCQGIAQLVEQQQAAYTNICSIEHRVAPLNREEQTVKDLAEKCTDEGRQLVCTLENLGIDWSGLQKRNLALSIKAVVKGKWGMRHIVQHREQLKNSQDQLNLALVSLIRYDVTSTVLRELDSANTDLAFVTDETKTRTSQIYTN